MAVGISLLALVLLWILQSPWQREPSYQDRTLSEWLAFHTDWAARPPEPASLFPSDAILAMGTNSLPHLLKWIQYEPNPRLEALFAGLPRRFQMNHTIQRLVLGSPRARAAQASAAFEILGTNALAAAPRLGELARDMTHPRTAVRAIFALRGLGAGGVPALQAAFVHPAQTNRRMIVSVVRGMIRNAGTNACVPLLVAALHDRDEMVRAQAHDVLKRIAPEVLTNAPAP